MDANHQPLRTDVDLVV